MEVWLVLIPWLCSASGTNLVESSSLSIVFHTKDKIVLDYVYLWILVRSASTKCSNWLIKENIELWSNENLCFHISNKVTASEFSYPMPHIDVHTHPTGISASSDNSEYFTRFWLKFYNDICDNIYRPQGEGKVFTCSALLRRVWYAFY